MKHYNTFAETEDLLQTAMGLPGRSVKAIAAATGMKPNTLHKWKSSGKGHLSLQKADKLLIYFIQNEPERLEYADLLQMSTIFDNVDNYISTQNESFCSNTFYNFAQMQNDQIETIPKFLKRLWTITFLCHG